MSVDPKRAQAVFLRTVDLAAEDRFRALDAMCGLDGDLRQRVIALLAAHESDASLLDGPPAGLRPTALAPTAGGWPVQPALPACTRAGPYTLMQKLGEGGMGTVWTAEQRSPIRRRVALKLIKPGMDSAQVLLRFEAERQALALMDHTNIAKVFDAGTTPDGRPFFAMELVKGVPITTYCDELSLPVRARLELFVAVCHAIQHAHTKGVIHRDVKPSNVLVAIEDGKPVPKVIDFGVAKALHQPPVDRATYTEIGSVVGTFEYMSPEQTELSGVDIDTRSDVYALGVLLYELLTGSTPIERDRLADIGFVAFHQLIREEDPPRPSVRLWAFKAKLPEIAARRGAEPARLRKELRGDLDRIVMRCLEKDRTRRYETADALARDVERHLADEPIDARAPSRAYRLRKFLRRNRGPLAAAGLIFVALSAGTAAAGWQAIRATKARQLADARADQIRGDLARLRTANVLAERGRQDRLAQRWDEAEAALTKAISLRPEFLAAWTERFELYADLGLWDHASEDLTRAAAIREPDASFRWYQQSLLTLYDGDTDGFQALRRAMRGRFHRGLDPSSEIDLVRTSALLAGPDREAAEMAALGQRLMASRNRDDWFSRYLMGMTFYRVGDYARAAEQLEASTRSGPPFDAMGYPGLAMALHRLGRADEARAALDAAAGAIERWTQEAFASHRDAYWVTRLGAAPHLPVAWWDWLEFQVYYREAKLHLDGAAPADDARLHALRARAYSGLHRMDEADAEYRAALRLRPNEPQIRFEAHRDRASAHAEARRFGEAAAEFAHATDLRPDDFQLWRFRAVAHFAAGDADAYRAACEAMLDRFGTTDDPVAACNVGYACSLSGDVLADQERLSRLADVAAPQWHFGSWVRGAILYRTGRYEEAVRWLEAAQETYHPRAWDWAFLAMARHRLGDEVGARRCLAEASHWIKEADRAHGDDRSDSRWAWGGYDERLVYPLVVREAERLIGKQKVSRPAPPEV